jgi:hypothetical protein
VPNGTTSTRERAPLAQAEAKPTRTTARTTAVAGSPAGLDTNAQAKAFAEGPQAAAKPVSPATRAPQPPAHDVRIEQSENGPRTTPARAAAAPSTPPNGRSPGTRARGRTSPTVVQRP